MFKLFRYAMHLHQAIVENVSLITAICPRHAIRANSSLLFHDAATAMVPNLFLTPPPARLPPTNGPLVIYPCMPHARPLTISFFNGSILAAPLITRPASFNYFFYLAY